MYNLIDYLEFENNLDKINNFESNLLMFRLKLLDKKSFSDFILKFNSIKNNFNNYKFVILVSIEKQFQGINSIINNLKNYFDIVIGQGGLNIENKFFIESTNIDYLLDAHNSNKNIRFDFIHHLNSGLNHVLINQANSKNIGFLISINDIKNNIKSVGKLNQNIDLFRKFRSDFSIINIVTNKNNEILIKNFKHLIGLFDISTTDIDKINNSINIRIEKKDMMNKKMLFDFKIEKV